MSDNLKQAQAEYSLIDLLERDYLIDSYLLAPHILRMWTFLIREQSIRQSGSLQSEQEKDLEKVRILMPGVKEEVFSKLNREFCEIAAANSQILQFQSLEHESVAAHLKYFNRALQSLGEKKLSWFKAADLKIAVLAIMILLIAVYSAFAWLKQSWNPLEWKKTRYHEFTIEDSQQDWGALSYDQNMEGASLNVGGKSFSYGLATHARSRIVLSASRGKKIFSGGCGMDATSGGKGLFKCSVRQGDKVLFASEMITPEAPITRFKVEIDPAEPIVLRVDSQGKIDHDHADWLDLKLE